MDKQDTNIIGRELNWSNNLHYFKSSQKGDELIDKNCADRTLSIGPLFLS